MFRPVPPAALLLALLTAGAQAQGRLEYRQVVSGVRVSTSPLPSGTTPTPPPNTPPSLSYRVEASSSSLDFGSVLVGQSEFRQVLLSNVGTGALTLSALQVQGAMFSASTSCGAVLSAGASCVAGVTFSPTSFGEAVGTLVLTSNATNGPLSVPLRGNGTQAQGQLVADTSADFGMVSLGESARRTFTFVNTGTAPATQVRASVSGVALSVVANSCGTAQQPVTLSSAPGPNSCSLTVEWTPSSGGSLGSGAITVESSAGNSPNSLALAGTALAATATLSADSSASFGAVLVGQSATRTFTYKNEGPGAAVGVYVTVTGTNLTLGATSCGTPEIPVRLASGEQCSVTVQYAPTATGAMSGTLTAAGSAVAGTSTLSLEGTAIGPVTFSYTGSLASYVVPRTGVYSIDARGARGSPSGGGLGGGGAQLVCEVSLQAGATLRILVPSGGLSGAGGGGAFVASSTNQPLVVAGGGGGASNTTGGGNARGLTGTTSGGAAGAGAGGGGGGAGFSGNGGNGTNFYGGISFTNGSALSSGSASVTWRAGGYGGGGTGGTYGTYQVAGGGGGYNGGSGGSNDTPGTGGSSYCAGTASFISLGTMYNNTGKVIITPLP